MKYPDWICYECGTKYGAWYQNGVYTGPSNHCSTNHMGSCGICKNQDVSVTEPRDYGHLLNWDVVRKDIAREDYKRKKLRKTRTTDTG